MIWNATSPPTILASEHSDAITLHFINQSLEIPPPDVMIWQHNDAPGCFSTPTAWKVIHRCGYDWHHPFVLPNQLYVRIHDGSGSGQNLPAAPGTELRVLRTSSGALSFEAASSHEPTVFQICNLAEHGAITVEVWRGNGLLAIQPRLTPGAMAPFRFPPTVLISAVSQIEPGAPLLPNHWLGMPVELNLLGVLNADLLMVGGGQGATSSPLRFHLHNISTWHV